MRRNFGETVRLATVHGLWCTDLWPSFQPHEQEEIVSMWGPDAPHVPPERAARNFGIAVAVFTTLALIAKAGTPARPSAPREYPYSGLVTELGGLEENKARYITLNTVISYILILLQANPETLDEE